MLRPFYYIHTLIRYSKLYSAKQISIIKVEEVSSFLNKQTVITNDYIILYHIRMIIWGNILIIKP